VRLNIRYVNRPPVAVNDTYNLDQRTSVSGNVTANDSDPDGDTIHVALVRGPAGGTLQLSGNGAFIYRPTGDYFGTDSFTYVVDDGKAVGNTATVTLTIRYVNRPPIATNGSYSVDPSAVFGGNLTTFAYDPDGDPLTVRLVNGPTYGRLVLHTDGTFTYSGSLLNPGADSFTYQVGDGQYFSATETITINLVRRGGFGYFIRGFWGLSAPGTEDAVSETLQVQPARVEELPALISFAPATSTGMVDDVCMTLSHSVRVPLPAEAVDATAVTVVSVRVATTDESLSASLVTASLAEGKIDFVFNPSLPPGAYDLIIRLTRADGSTLELPFTVFMGEGPD
jgi:hypothetical protein